MNKNSWNINHKIFFINKRTFRYILFKIVDTNFCQHYIILFLFLVPFSGVSMYKMGMGAFTLKTELDFGSWVHKTPKPGVVNNINVTVMTMTEVTDYRSLEITRWQFDNYSLGGLHSERNDRLFNPWVSLSRKGY